MHHLKDMQDMHSLTLIPAAFRRFLRQFILFFAVHLSSVSMFRFLASAFRTMVASATAGSFAILLVLLFGGFIIPQRKATLFIALFPYKFRIII